MALITDLLASKHLISGYWVYGHCFIFAWVAFSHVLFSYYYYLVNDCGWVFGSSSNKIRNVQLCLKERKKEIWSSEDLKKPSMRISKTTLHPRDYPPLLLPSVQEQAPRKEALWLQNISGFLEHSTTLFLQLQQLRFSFWNNQLLAKVAKVGGINLIDEIPHRDFCEISLKFKDTYSSSFNLRWVYSPPNLISFTAKISAYVEGVKVWVKVWICWTP